MSNVMTPENDFTDDERRLYELMSEISEDCYCARWMNGNEFALWDAITTGDLRYGMGEMDRDQLAQVAALSVKTGKWIIWCDDHDGLDPHDPSEWGPYAITLKEWAGRRAAPAAGTEKDAESRIPDMALLIARLSYALKKAAPEHEMPAKATAYLKKHNLIDSPLRADDPEVHKAGGMSCGP